MYHRVSCKIFNSCSSTQFVRSGERVTRMEWSRRNRKNEFESGGNRRRDTFYWWKCRRHDPAVGGRRGAVRGNEPSRAASFYLDNQVIGPATPLGIAECREPLESLLQQSISWLFPF